MSNTPSEDPPGKYTDLLPKTPDGREERLAVLKNLFPDLFTNEGRLNPDELKQLVAPNEVHETERYEFRWYGKAASKRAAFTPTTATLVYDEKRSVNPDKAGGNMIIEGENLETLKLLLNAYREQVKCIYIDPPYNTGKDFIYRDNYRKDKKSYWEESGASEDGVMLESNAETSGRFHSDWLSMMHSRFLVARSLLRPNGVIFVSIDDREIVNTVRTMAEVFGEENHLATFVRRRRLATGMRENSVSPDHEYVVAFARQLEQLSIRGFERRGSDYPFEDAVGKYRSTDLTVGMNKEMRPNQFYPITSPVGGTDYWPPEDRVWRFEPNSMRREIETGNLIWPDATPDSRMSRPRFKTRFSPNDGETNPVSTWIQARTGNGTTAEFTSWSAGLNTEATKKLRDIFGDQLLEYPKPVTLLKDLFFVATEKDDLIMDFFAGSGTTAQAVTELNQADGGKRRFILAQLPEVTDGNSTAFKAGYKKISDITIERVKRVIEGYGDKSQPLPEAGFKVYRLTKSNFPRCEFKPNPEDSEAEKVAALKRYIDEKESAFFMTLDGEGEQAVFDEVLLKNGFQLHYTRERAADFTGNTVYEVSDGRRTALVCLAWSESIKESTIARLRTMSESDDQPFFICLERSLSTTAKWNLKHFLKTRFTAF